MRSSTIGPPTDGLTAQFSSSSVADSSPRLRRSSSRLLASRAGKLNAVFTVPLNALAPSRGIMLIDTPPVSNSAELPE